MDLLISVRNGDEAAAAVAGGAGIIDGKEPAAGALGRVAPSVLRQIASVAQTRLITAALGDATSVEEVERTAAAYVGCGASLVKIGFAGSRSRGDVDRFLAAASRGAGSQRVIAVAYADFDRVDGPAPLDVVEAAVAAGVAGVLLDTAVKDGAGTLHLLDPGALQSLVSESRRGDLLVAVAGKLTVEDLRRVKDLGADVAGVRGAACDGGRNGRVSAAKVRELCGRVYAMRDTAPRPSLSVPAM